MIDHIWHARMGGAAVPVSGRDPAIRRGKSALPADEPAAHVYLPGWWR
jgi:hypothetical protein